MADGPNAAVSDDSDEIARDTTTPGSGPPPPPSPGRPAAHPAHEGPPAAKPPAPKRAGLRRFILPGPHSRRARLWRQTAYNWLVEGRFIVSTDDAYVGADTAIIAAKAPAI